MATAERRNEPIQALLKEGRKFPPSKTFVKGSAWSQVRGVYRHKVTEIYEIHYLGGTVRTAACLAKRLRVL